MKSLRSSASSSNVWKENGAKAQPPNSANLEKDSTQANLREWSYNRQQPFLASRTGRIHLP